VINAKLLGRLTALEAALTPPGRNRCFFLPRAMSEAERAAWLAQQAPDLRPADQVVFIGWVLPGERPAERCGEVGRRPVDQRGA
jgi:hypothetical protein